MEKFFVNCCLLGLLTQVFCVNNVYAAVWTSCSFPEAVSMKSKTWDHNIQTWIHDSTETTTYKRKGNVIIIDPRNTKGEDMVKIRTGAYDTYSEGKVEKRNPDSGELIHAIREDSRNRKYGWEIGQIKYSDVSETSGTTWGISAYDYVDGNYVSINGTYHCSPWKLYTTASLAEINKIYN